MVNNLSSRQLEIVSLLWLANAEIAIRLGISESTVKQHIANIMTKTGSNTRTEIVMRMYQLIN